LHKYGLFVVGGRVMSNKRGRYPNTLAPGQVDPATQVRIPALVEELRAATTKVEDEVQQKRARLLEDTLNEMSPDMEARFEFYMRSHFNYRNVKKILQKEIECATRDVMTSAHASEDQVQFNSTYSGGAARPIYGAPTVSDDMAIVVCGLAKLYVGELVDTAKDVMMERLAATAENGVPRSPPQAVVASAEDGANHQSAFNMIASLGAAVTNEILQLTRADIEEAGRRMSDKGQHARDISGQTTVPLFSSQSQATGSTRFSSVASIMMPSSTEGRGGGDLWYVFCSMSSLPLFSRLCLSLCVCLSLSSTVCLRFLALHVACLTIISSLNLSIINRHNTHITYYYNTGTGPT
jgi:hypothetical protein